MKKNKTHELGDINLEPIIFFLWKNKFLILSISILCSFLYYFQITKNIKKGPEIFQSIITIALPSKNLFLGYEMVDDINSIHSQYVESFLLNITSRNNLNNFLRQSRFNENLQSILKEKNIKRQEYFNKNFGKVDEQNYKFFLNFYDNFEGDAFLNEYIKYTKYVVLDEKIKDIRRVIQHRIELINYHINLAEYIKSEKNLQLITEDEFKSLSLNDLSKQPQTADILSLDLNPTLLSMQADYIKSLSSRMNRDSFYFNEILDNASLPVKISKDQEIYKTAIIFKGFLYGFILSLTILFFRNRIKKN